jgi:hypothetical protein
MPALLKQFQAAGVRFQCLPDGRLKTLGTLTDELRTQIRAAKPAILAELRASEAANDADDLPGDPDVARRRAQALAMLAAHAELRIAIVAEAGDPVIVGIAVRGVAYGELVVTAATYDPFALLALLEQHGREQTVH